MRASERKRRDKKRNEVVNALFVFDEEHWIYRLRKGVKPQEALARISEHGICPACHRMGYFEGRCIQCRQAHSEVKRPYTTFKAET